MMEGRSYTLDLTGVGAMSAYTRLDVIDNVIRGAGQAHGESVRVTLLLAAVAKGGSRKIGNNTSLEQRGEAVAVRYHKTDIVTFGSDGVTILTGGYQTPSTADRINRAVALVGFTAYLDKGLLYLGWRGQSCPIGDALTVLYEGPLPTVEPIKDAYPHVTGWRFFEEYTDKTRRRSTGSCIAFRKDMPRYVQGGYAHQDVLAAVHAHADSPVATASIPANALSSFNKLSCYVRVSKLRAQQLHPTLLDSIARYYST